MRQIEKKTSTIIILFSAFFVIAMVSVRAAITGLTYDEAYTYLFYAYPLYKNFTLERLCEYSNTALANNHWLNTLLITLFTKATGIIYQELLIRLPSLIFGWVYYLYAAYCKLKNKIGWTEFVLLIGSYYANEFFGLARGYGMCMSLVFIGLIKYKDFEVSQKLSDFWKAMFILVISAYANSVSLLIIGALGCAFILRQICYKKNFVFVKQNIIMIPLWLLSVAYIVWYHFRITDIDNGMPLYRTDYTGGVLFYLKQYTYLSFHTEDIIFLISLGLLMFISTLYLLLKKRLFEKELGVAFLIHFCGLMLIEIIFKRGGLLYRTLLPAYPLFVLGLAELVKGCLDDMKKVNAKTYKVIAYIVAFVAAVFIILNGKHAFNLEGTNDWDNNYEIKWKKYSGFELPGDVIQDFYDNQKDSAICRIYGLEFDK